MTHQPQRFLAPDGTEMVVLAAADYERLLALGEDGEDVVAALAVEARIAAGESTVPGEVVRRIIDDGLSPLAAWRRYRGLSQAALARKTGLSQVWIGRIENGGGYGTAGTRRKLVEALGAPAWALEPEDAGDISAKTADRAPPDGKYRPLGARLEAGTGDRNTLAFAAIATLVGGLPASAFAYAAWWANARSHVQARSWLDAGFVVKADLKAKVATFTRA